jgi:hypothetical protein
MVLLTVVIPVAPYHLAAADEAIASCTAQTVPVDVVQVVDREWRGAGWARNQGLAQVITPFVTFLDADDLLAPTFAERMLTAYDGQRYVYCDHYQDAEHVRAPNQAWVDGSWHVVTTLLPAAWVRFVGGFDETLLGGEDTDLYWKLRYHGLCGQRLAEPLMQYRKGGRRSQTFFQTPQFHTFQTLLHTRYGGRSMACCGENADAPVPLNDQVAGAVLAQALWAGNRQQRGAVTGTLYPRAGNGALLWVDARDVTQSPHLWQQVVETPQPPGRVQVSEFQTFAQTLFGAPAARVRPEVRPNPTDEPIRPNVLRVMELYRKAVTHE